MRALIVDDHEATCTMLENFISPFGDCDVVMNGDEAVDAYLVAINEAKPYDLICLDIMMPMRDGHEVLSKIREYEGQADIAENRRVKVIMVSALDDKENILRATTYGCEYYLGKPVRKKQFVEAMKSLGIIEEQTK